MAKLSFEPRAFAPWRIDADAVAANLRLLHGPHLDEVLAPKPFLHAGVVVDAYALHTAEAPDDDPFERLLEQFHEDGMLPPGTLGVDVPFVAFVRSTFDPDAMGPARLHARRFVSRIARVNLHEAPVHGVTEIVAHLTLALAAFLHGRHHEANRELYAAAVHAELTNDPPGFGLAAFVRASRLLGKHTDPMEEP